MLTITCFNKLNQIKVSSISKNLFIWSVPEHEAISLIIRNAIIEIDKF